MSVGRDDLDGGFGFEWAVGERGKLAVGSLKLTTAAHGVGI